MLKAGKARDGHVTMGELGWSWQGHLSGWITFLCDLTDPHDAWLVLQFHHQEGQASEPVLQSIQLQYTVPQFGGRRWWMICPFEQVRAAKLYMPLHGGRFASRQAWRLGYRSQRIAPANKPLHRLFQFKERLGDEHSLTGPLVRPKGMWRRT